MTTSRLPAAVAALALMLASCGSAGAEILDLSSAPNASRSSSGEMAGDSAAMIAPANVEYTATEGLLADPGIDTSGEFRAWRFGAPGDAEVATRKVAAALGMKGKVTKDAYGSYVLTVGDATLSSYGDDNARWWSYWISSGVSTGVDSAPCEPTDPATTKDSAPDTPGCAQPPVTVPPAKNLPTATEARARVEAIMAELGHDSDGTLKYLVSSDEYSVSVSAEWILDDEATGVSWYFAFGEDGVMTSGGGQVFEASEADAYRVITIEQAVERLNSGMYAAMPYGWSSVAASRDLASPGAGWGSSATATKVTLEKVRASLMPYWTASGRQMLLPAYTFTGTAGESVQVLAVRDEYISRPVPSTDDVAVAPGSPGSGSSGSSGAGSGSPGADEPAVVVRTEEAQQLVGLAEDEAAKVAAGNGWMMRVVERDGESLMVTTDWVDNRVNVAVDSGKVSAVSSIG